MRMSAKARAYDLDTSAYEGVPGLGPLLAILITGLLFANRASSASEIVMVGQFSKSSLAGWEQKAFKGETDYTLVYDAAKKMTVLQAASSAAASGRFRRITVNLTETPFLNWSWKVSDLLVGNDEKAKAGDDFAARIYVVVERRIMGLTSLSVNYVWASQHPVGSSWASPFTGRVRLMAINSGATNLNSWVAHKRNVRRDLKEQFGEDITSIDAVALMTDTDNSGRYARAFYGDIWFSAE